MMIAALSALPGILLVAAGTPRQAAALSSHRLHQARRRALRLDGFALLLLSLGVATTGADRARHLVAWIGTIGLEAVAVALLFTAGSRSRRT